MAAMRWQDLRTSQYMEDRRGGGGSSIPLGRGGLGIGPTEIDLAQRWHTLALRRGLFGDGTVLLPA